MNATLAKQDGDHGTETCRISRKRTLLNCKNTAQKSPVAKRCQPMVWLVMVCSMLSMFPASANPPSMALPLTMEPAVSSRSYQSESAYSRILSDMNPLANPCNDFYQYSCGGYIDKHLTMMEGSYADRAEHFQKDIKEQLRMFLEYGRPDTGRLPTVAQKLRTFYRSCRNSKTANFLSALRQMVVDLGGFVTFSTAENASSFKLTDTLIKAHSKYTLDALFSVIVHGYRYNSSKNVINLLPPYFGQNPAFSNLQISDFLSSNERNRQYAGTSRVKRQAASSSSDISKWVVLNVIISNTQEPLSFNDVRNFSSLTTTINGLQQKNDVSIQKVVNIAWLKENIPSIEWDQYFLAMFEKAGVSNVELNDSMTIVLNGKEYFIRLGKLLNWSLSAWQFKKNLLNYVVFQAISRYFGSFYLGYIRDNLANLKDDKRFTDDYSEMATKCLEDTVVLFGVPTGAIYVDLNLKSLTRTKEKVKRMGENVVSAYHEEIAQSKWLDSVTKQSALYKLEAMKVSAVFDDWMLNDTYVNSKFMDYEMTDDFATNLLAFYRFEYVTSNLRKLNEAAGVAGYVADPIYQSIPDVPDAFYYGALGTVIAHEITHGFDPLGRTYDKDGNLRDWWLNRTTLNIYESKVACFLNQFRRYHQHRLFQDNARKALGDNIADSVAVSVAFKAFQKAQLSSDLIGKAKVIPGLNLSEQQLFFLGNAQRQCIVYTAEVLLSTLLGDHAPYALRVRGSLENSEDFPKVFKCAQRNQTCTLW